MATPYQAYRKHATSDWTRVDMLIALFDKASDLLDKIHEALENNDETQYHQQTLTFMQVMMHFRTGVDLDRGEFPQRLIRLYGFVESCVMSRDARQLDAARVIIRDLRNAYHEIRESAAAMERAGEIPSLRPEHLCDQIA